MQKVSLRTDERGFSLVEALLSGALFALLSVAFVSATIYGIESAGLAGRRAQALLLAEEGLEAARNIRDRGYAFLSVGTWGLSASGASWALSGASDTTDIFTRSLTVTKVGDYKETTSTVTWQQSAQRSGSIALVTRFTDWISERLGDWTNPSTQATLNLAGTDNGVKVQTSGDYAYVIRTSGAPMFAVINVANPASPSLSGSLVLTGTPVNIAVAGNYAYVTTTSNAAELQIVDISNPVLPVLAGTYNAPGTADGAGVFASGSTVYLGRTSSAEAEFSIVNAGNPLLPTVTGSLNLSGNANELEVSGSYAYVASSDNAAELQVVNVATPSTPTLAGSLGLVGNDDAATIAFLGTHVILGRSGAGSVAVVNVSTPTTPTLATTLSPGAPVSDIALIGTTYALVASSNAAAEFRVIDVSVPASATFVGIVDTPAALNGLAYDAIHDRAYAVSIEDTGEFLVIRPN